jgi:prevent-host-death family protein
VKTVSVSELKENLSRYLRRAQRGGEIQVVNRGRPVARLIGLRGAELDDDERRERLVAAGVVRAGDSSVATALPKSPLRVPGLNLSASLAEERGDRV